MLYSLFKHMFRLSPLRHLLCIRYPISSAPSFSPLGLMAVLVAAFVYSFKVALGFNI